MSAMLSNRRARHDYELLDTYEAGLSLTGSEVKSLRQGGGSLTEAFVRADGTGAWLEGMNLPKYEQASYNNHDPLRKRRLLLHRSELAQIRKGIERGGLTCVPTKLYFKGGWAKVEIALARGRKKHDKRRADAEKDARKEMSRALER